MLKLLITSLLTLLLSACNQTKPIDDPGESGKALKNDNRPSEEVVGIPGYKMNCREQSLSRQKSEVTCRLLNDSDEPVDLATVAKAFSYDIVSPAPEAFTKFNPETAFGPIGYLVDLEQASAYSKEQLFAESSVALHVEFNDGRPALNIQAGLADAIVESTPVQFQHYRAVIQSVEASLLDATSACLVDIQFFNNGSAYPATVSPEGQQLLGGQQVTVTASTFSGPGHEATEALIGDGSFWESAYDVFALTAPHDALQETWFQISFTNSLPLPIHGLSFIPQAGGYPQGECIPDKVTIQGSLNGVDWRVLQEFDTPNPSAQSSILYNWN